MTVRQRIVQSIGLVMLAAACTAGCGGSGGSAPTAAEPTAPAAPPTSAASQDLDGAHVRVLGLWSGPEFDSFEAVKAAWEQDTGGIVDWVWTRDLPGELDD